MDAPDTDSWHDLMQYTRDKRILEIKSAGSERTTEDQG